MVHRVLFEKYHGKILEDRFVDHIDRVITDNSIDNLRLVSREQNNQNISLRKDNSSGSKNIYWSKNRKKWLIQFDISVPFDLLYKICKVTTGPSTAATHLSTTEHFAPKATYFQGTAGTKRTPLDYYTTLTL
jgi:hypothetical protein